MRIGEMLLLAIAKGLALPSGRGEKTQRGNGLAGHLPLHVREALLHVGDLHASRGWPGTSHGTNSGPEQMPISITSAHVDGISR